MVENNVNITEDPFDPTGPDVDDPFEMTPPVQFGCIIAILLLASFLGAMTAVIESLVK